MTSMTITCPTGEPGAMAVFKIEFDSSMLNDVIEFVGLLVKPSDVYLAQEMGIWIVA